MAMTLKPKSNHPNPLQWKAFCYDWGDKRKIETRAGSDTKKHVSEVFRGSEGRYFKGDKIVINTF